VDVDLLCVYGRFPNWHLCSDKTIYRSTFYFLFFCFLFFVIIKKAGADPWDFYPSGTLGSGITTFFGDPGENTMGIMQATSIGVVFIVTYHHNGEERKE
jgi:hypothetical protein